MRDGIVPFVIVDVGVFQQVAFGLSRRLADLILVGVARHALRGLGVGLLLGFRAFDPSAA